MPKVNYSIATEPMYCKLKYGEEPQKLEFLEQLSHLKVSIINAPSEYEFKETIARFMLNSWSESPRVYFSNSEMDECVRQLFAGEILPNGQEIIGITFCIENLDLIDVTHLIRHRGFTFSAQCSDRDLRNLPILIKPSIAADEGFRKRYMEICNLQNELYIDMMDSGKICTFDARTVMPISKTHFYNCRACIKDIIAYVNQRSDEQIQTQVDNIIAIKLWTEVVKLYPFLKHVVNLRKKSDYYINQCKSGKTTIFPPNKKNDVFNWSDDQFFHHQHRDSFLGGNEYIGIRDKLLEEFDSL